MHLSLTVAIIFSLSILLAGIIAIFRFGQIRDVYRPFIYLIWLACINELLSIYLLFHHHYTIVNYTIYSICEAFLLLWFFKNLGIFKHRKLFFYFLVVLFTVIWIIESFFSKRFGSRFNYYFDIVYSFFVVLLSIRAINNLLFTERDLLKNPTFLICIGTVIFFTYEIIETMFSLYGLKASEIFTQNVQSLLMIVNLLSNLIYALAILWMRKRQAFTLQF
jgi:hypothetical protein